MKCNLIKQTIFLFALYVLVSNVSCTETVKSGEFVNLSLSIPSNFTQTISYYTKTEGDMGSMTSSEDFEFRLKGIKPDSSYIFIQTLKHIVTSNKLNGENVQFDSAKDTIPEQMSESARSLYDEFNYLIDLGQEVNVGTDGRLKSKDGDNAEASLLSTERSILPIELPNKTVQEGFEWVSIRNNPVVKEKKIKTTYTLSKITDKELLIDLVMEVEGVFGENGYKAEGTVFLDKKTRVIIKGEYLANTKVMNKKNKIIFGFKSLN